MRPYCSVRRCDRVSVFHTGSMIANPGLAKATKTQRILRMRYARRVPNNSIAIDTALLHNDSYLVPLMSQTLVATDWLRRVSLVRKYYF